MPTDQTTRTIVGSKGNPLVVVERVNTSNIRNLGPEGQAPSSLKTLPIITGDQRKTGRVG
jgi:hypothetical protein